MLVINKTDIADPEVAAALSRRHPDAVVVSAKTGEGFGELLKRISAEAARGGTTITVLVPYTRGDLVQLAHERAHVVSERHVAEGTQIVIQASDEVIRRLREFEIEGDSEAEATT
jgi:GTP-binding protein HflX